MSTGIREKRLRRRIRGLYSTDPQFAAGRPDDEITVAISRPELRLAQIAAIVMEGYANRPAGPRDHRALFLECQMVAPRPTSGATPNRVADGLEFDG